MLRLDEVAFDHSTSIMVALKVPSPVVHKLEMAGIYNTDDAATPEDPLHVTLVYLGKDQRDKLDACIQSVTRCVNQGADVMTANITGFAKFKEGDDGVPVVALVSCKGLEHLKVDLELALIEDGIEIPSEYGFIPHMTIRYDKDDSELPVLETEVSWTVDHVTIFADNNSIRIPVPFKSSKKVESFQEFCASCEICAEDLDERTLDLAHRLWAVLEEGFKLKPGDKVKVSRTGEVGVVRDVKGNDAWILIKGFVWRYSQSNLEKV